MRLRAFAIAALFAATAQAQVVWVRTTMAGKPTCAAGIKGRVFEISDATTESDCSTGGATGNARKMSLCWCVWTAGTSAYEWQAIARGAGVADHGALTGLSDDDHAQYALLAGRSGGQTLVGGTGAGDVLTLRGTSNAAIGKVVITEPGTDIGLAFSGNTGHGWRSSSGAWYYVSAGVDTWAFYGADKYFKANLIGWESGNGPKIYGGTSSGTSPNIMPDQSDGNTGIGTAGADQLSLTAGGVEAVRVVSTGATVNDILLITPRASAPTCNAGAEGSLYSDTSHALCFCDGTTWLVAVGAGSCA